MEGFYMEKIKKNWLAFFQEEQEHTNWWTRKKGLLNERQAEIVRINGYGNIFHRIEHDQETSYHYLIHLSFLVKQDDYFYQEEQTIPYQFKIVQGEVMDHQEIQRGKVDRPIESLVPDVNESGSDQRFSYDRRAAVNYAEHWWNSYNPDFRKFDVDCTNFISQCLLAGGAPMRGAPARGQGWWYQNNNWSYSWAVAHSLRWYLSGSTHGLTGKEVQKASELNPGDVICYDFQGDGRWDHNTIVVAKDANGMPLVNAHTNNSRHRYWSYEDSAAWTPNITYKFFRIGEK